MARGQCGHAVDLVAIQCHRQRCRRWFCLCRRCYRGHRYCGKRCREAASKARKEAARNRHIAKDPEAARAAQNRRQRACRRRARDVGKQGGAQGEKAPQARDDEETVTDHGSTPSDPPLSDCVDEANRPEGPKRPGQNVRPRGRQRCQRCGRWGRVVLWVSRRDKTPSFRRLL